MAKSHMVVVDGYIGSDPRFRTRARLIMEAANAHVAGANRTVLIVGLSGTGKTTTTFTTQLGSKPVQDDFVCSTATRFSRSR